MIKRAYHSLKSTVLGLDFKYVLQGGFWLSLSQVVAVISVLATSYVFANYVDPTDYGFYKYILTLGVIFGAFSLTGILQSVMQATAKGYLSFIFVGFKNSLLYGLSITGIAIAGATYYFLNQNMAIALGCLLVALFVPLINSGQLIYAHLQGSRQFYLAAKLQIIKILITSATVLAAIFFTDNILLVVATYFIINAAVSIGVYLYTTTKKIAADTTNVGDTLQQKYLSYAKHTSVRNVLSGLAHEVDKVLVFQKLGAVELAIYAFAIAIPEQLKGVFKNISLLVLVKFSGYDMEHIKNDLMKKVLLLALILFSLTIIYIFSAPFIYTALFPAYTESILLSQLFALSFLATIAIFPVSALQSQMKEKELHYLNISTSVLLIISIYIGITLFGLIGLVISRVIVRYTYCATAFILVYKNAN